MTIAAGFAHREGVLLCADTELTAGDLKLHASKLARVECPFGRVGMVFAGHFDNATSTMQKIARALQKLKPLTHPLETIESVLEREYPRIVWNNPDRQFGLAFSLIFAIQPRNGSAELFISNENTIRAGNTYETTGSGSVVASQIIQAGQNAFISSERACVLASYMLSHTKRHASGVGGMSLIMDFAHNGTFAEFYDDQYLKKLEDFFSVYQFHAWNLALEMTDIRIDDAGFRRALQSFAEDVFADRQKWTEAREIHQQHREAYRIATTPKAKSAPQSSRHDRKDEPPSRG
jgi:hypothetical protein